MRIGEILAVKFDAGVRQDSHHPIFGDRPDLQHKNLVLEMARDRKTGLVG